LGLVAILGCFRERRERCATTTATTPQNALIWIVSLRSCWCWSVPLARIALKGCGLPRCCARLPQLLALLSTPGLPDNISTKWIGEQVGAPWRDWGRKVLKRPETQACLQSLGWRYVPSRGPGGAKLVRDTRGAVYTVAGALETVRNTAGNLWS
jgi:hypothetical protein